MRKEEQQQTGQLGHFGMTVQERGRGGCWQRRGIWVGLTGGPRGQTEVFRPVSRWEDPGQGRRAPPQVQDGGKSWRRGRPGVQ